MWKLANVTPIYKKGGKQLIKNYRPISLLPICGKMFEKIISNNLYRYLNGNNLITNNLYSYLNANNLITKNLYSYLNANNLITKNLYRYLNANNLITNNLYSYLNANNLITNNLYSYLNANNLITKNLYSYLNGNNLITKNQSGFRPGDSTTNQLLYLVNEIHEAFEDPKSLEVRTVFLDISKAFDKVWHDGLILKLKQNGISDRLIKLFEIYLHNRKQHVVLNGFHSDYSLIEAGVPQGSVLGPPIIPSLHQ